MDLLSLEFIQRALIAAVLAGVTSPSIGSYIVQRRLSLLGDGLGHVAIAGVGLALATGTAPLPVAVTGRSRPHLPVALTSAMAAE